MDGERDTARDERDPLHDRTGAEASPSGAGFTFNLGAALDRLGSPKSASLADLLAVGEDDEPAPPEPLVALPDIAEATSVEAPLHPLLRPLARSETPLPAAVPPPPATFLPPAPATRPSGPIITPVANAVPAAAAAAETPSAPAMVGAVAVPPTEAAGMRSTPSTGAVAVLDPPAVTTVPATSAPVLPAVPAYVPPVAAAPAAAPLVTPGVVRPVVRKQKKSRFGLKSFLVLVVLGGLVAAGLVYGRAYLFPDEWERDLVPIADELESDTGREFVEAVHVEVLAPTSYPARAAQALFGAEWAQQFPRWRALGLAAGTETSQPLADALTSWAPAVYDPVTGEAVRIESVGGTARVGALTNVLATVLVDQLAGANLAIAPGSSVAERAVIAQQIELTADEALGVAEPTSQRASLANLPSPLAYELLARVDLGAPLAAAAGIELAASDPAGVATLPGSLDDLLADATDTAPPAEVAPGDIVAADATAQGRTFWYLVFGAYLPAASAAAGADAIQADLLTPVSRADRACAYGTFRGATPDATNVLLVVAQAWVAAAPPEANATVATLADGSIQLATCDPGEAATVLPRTDVASELVARQVALLAAA